MADEARGSGLRRPWRALFQRAGDEAPNQNDISEKRPRPTWTMGILNDRETIEVPGSVLLLSKERNEPLGLRNAPARTSHSSLPTGMLPEPPMTPSAKEEEEQKKLTGDGRIILDPQPDDSHNDPLNWPAWRRDCALISLGLFSMVGGGITPIIAAGFTDVAHDFNVDVSRVSLTTGLYMLGLGLGCVIFSPTAILYGKRPVYLFGSILFILSAVWCALSPSFTSLILARIFQGIAVSPVECLPSATIAEIFFLHERAFRIGIYTLLLLGGKNLVPLVSAVIINQLDWRWVFWVVAIIRDRLSSVMSAFAPETEPHPVPGTNDEKDNSHLPSAEAVPGAPPSQHDEALGGPSVPTSSSPAEDELQHGPSRPQNERKWTSQTVSSMGIDHASPISENNFNSAAQNHLSTANYFHDPEAQRHTPHALSSDTDSEKMSFSNLAAVTMGQVYTHRLREAPRQSFKSQLKVHNGRINQDKWWKAAVRPFILYSYPAVLWSSAVYACSVGWLIVISECVAVIYREGYYQFDALSTGLVYIAPFVGGVLGTAVAGRVSDVIVKAMARRNGGLYEPEFRLVMAIPITITTVIGLIGFGWSADVEDPWIVPTVFFGIISFGCSLGSTTAITFCVDSYRQYAGEALVTLNFSKNVLHGLVFSFFVTGWLKTDGSKTVFVWISVIQLIVLLSTIPMYIYGKRARMWTVRMNLMEKF
ncbi:hypothetical protein EKO27_g5929 [Xylaria grammica]|uniref:Major facilitator superfamily (MFS) profile domain-containing protein n=1 Tax=Xylaria grammica TaxID=363999 RepID=A0A439D433_9PEZI|nr:hypothetical protein EKO27_g5929 [Xylaria grammica]